MRLVGLAGSVESASIRARLFMSLYGLNDASAPRTDETAMVANACSDRHQRGGNNLVVGLAPMAVVNGLAVQSCSDPCFSSVAEGYGSLWL